MVSTSSQDAQREARRRKGGPSKSVRDLGWDPLRPDGLEQRPFSGEFRNGFKAFLGFNKQLYDICHVSAQIIATKNTTKTHPRGRFLEGSLSLFQENLDSVKYYSIWPECLYAPPKKHPQKTPIQNIFSKFSSHKQRLRLIHLWRLGDVFVCHDGPVEPEVYDWSWESFLAETGSRPRAPDRYETGGHRMGLLVWEGFFARNIGKSLGIFLRWVPWFYFEHDVFSIFSWRNPGWTIVIHV